ncbi:YjjG family noncanonical pyrimidine nucleotidase [Polaribacter sp. Z014]|uniref:YjjG family noncanonical pyrimidine nucleotidase n=1 Tax=unclassified Polaribacter TaxID=196858 RepID=UPI00193C6E48|nr:MULTISPECIES: YjjG family noncanonical pyrimidine nucleotidase [unclassified Polaribacter]MCL7763688.1 YjjG family noncanonical pyrimidine nucleotidase [Polaribacter sp. Z014]QVY65354.1 YjjG family noncanonical pyrimidine nucleotidase [Polaribacter sp. Q13]
MKNIQHVFFDLDHTLWDFEKNSDLAFQKVFTKHSILVSIDSFLTVYKPLNFKYWKLYREEKVTKEELRYGRLKKSFDALNYTISDDLIDEIAINYLEFLPHFNHLFDGTFEILDYLKRKYTLHIITNGFDEVQHKKMMSSNIYHYFDKIITSESVGVKKPNAKVFNYALELANADKSNSVMIGDNLEADIEGAINVGMQAIYCNFENNSFNNNELISVKTLLEIKQYL